MHTTSCRLLLGMLVAVRVDAFRIQKRVKAVKSCSVTTFSDKCVHKVNTYESSDANSPNEFKFETGSDEESKPEYYTISAHCRQVEFLDNDFWAFAQSQTVHLEAGCTPFSGDLKHDLRGLKLWAKSQDEGRLSAGTNIGGDKASQPPHSAGCYEISDRKTCCLYSDGRSDSWGGYDCVAAKEGATFSSGSICEPSKWTDAHGGDDVGTCQAPAATDLPAVTPGLQISAVAHRAPTAPHLPAVTPGLQISATPHLATNTSRDPKATRFLTWNVFYRGLGAPERLHGIAEGLAEVQPEIVSMQEMCCGGAFAKPILENILDVTGQPWAFAAHDGQVGQNWDGPILYRTDLWEELGSGAITYDGTRGLSWAALRRRSDQTSVLVAGTHPICCREESYYMNTMIKLMDMLNEKKKTYPFPIIFMGDLNTPYYHPAQHFMRTGYYGYDGYENWNRVGDKPKEWTLSTTFHDPFGETHPSNPNQKTIEDGTNENRIDYVYAEKSPQNAGIVTGGKVWDHLPGGSDHFAVSGDILLR